MDRDEARFVQSSAQMLQTGDFIDIRFQDSPRDKKPVGINWLQALAVSAVSAVERREIWAYRLPSLLGGMVAAAACVWGAQAAFEARRAFFAGAIFAVGWLASSEAVLAKTDAVLCGAVMLAMAGLMRAYVRGSATGEPARLGERAALWAGLALGLLVKGAVAPLLIGLTLAALAITDRRAGWMRGLSWRAGLLFVAAIVLPWAMAITVSTDGAFWTTAAASDVLPKLAGGQEHHGAPPGTYPAAVAAAGVPGELPAPGRAGLGLAKAARGGGPLRAGHGWSRAGWPSRRRRPSCRIMCFRC